MRVEKEPAPNYFDVGVFDALVASGVLIQNSSPYCYTITQKAYEIADFDFNNPEPDPLRLYIKETHRLMLKCFNREELSQLCFELGVNPGWIFGDKLDWPFELLRLLYRQNRLKELRPILKELRPTIDWPKFPKIGNDQT